MMGTRQSVYVRAAPGRRPVIAEIVFVDDAGAVKTQPLLPADVIRWIAELAKLAEPVAAPDLDCVRFDPSGPRLDFFEAGRPVLSVEGADAVFLHGEVARHDPAHQDAVATGILAAIIAQRTPRSAVPGRPV